VLRGDDFGDAMTANTLPASPTARSRILGCAAVVLAFALPALALILADVRRTASYADQAEYHLPTIRQFADQWPAIDFRSYPAAMTPGYHLLMAAIIRAGGSTLALQLATLAITAGLLATLAWAVSRRLSAVDTLLLCLPMAWSQYVFTAGVWVVPHNLAWLGVLLVLLVATQSRWSIGSAVGGGLLLAATVFVRQIHLWAAAGLVCAAALAGGAKFDRLKARSRRLLVAVACCLPAVAVLYYFYRLWGSLAPTSQPWAKPAGGVNIAAITMVLATFGFLAPPLIARRPADRRQWRATIVGGIAGLAIALLTATTYDKDAGRWSGLWNLAGTLGVVSQRSLLITGLAAAGGACLGLLLWSVERRQAWIWAALLAGFIASSAAVNLAWQRYYEPMALMTVALMLRESPNPGTGVRYARAAAAAVQLALLVLSLTTAQ